jgi:hypothetical protein
MAIVLLWPAGTLAYPGGWAFIVLFAAAGSAISLVAMLSELVDLRVELLII